MERNHSLESKMALRRIQNNKKERRNKNTGNLDLIEIISGYISTLENLLKGGE